MTALGCAAALVGAGCGGGGERQDKNEPSGRFEVKVVRAEFPEKQKLAKRSEMRIEVRNAGDRAIPNIAVTVNSFDLKRRDPSDPSKIDPSVADPRRPVFVVNKAPIEFREDEGQTPDKERSLVDREVDPPAGADASTAYVNTFALGRLRAGESKTFRWSVTAVKAGPYRLSYRVAAGLDGKAKAVLASGGPVTGVFRGFISDDPQDARVGEDGRTIIREGEEIGPDDPKDAKDLNDR